MVTTFVPASSFRRCAKILDNRRLGKQRVEAMQILNIIEHLHLIASMYGYPACPREDGREADVARNEWVKEVRKRYFAESTRLTKACVRVDKASTDPDVIKLGFSQHACVRLWAGYEDGLRAYINAMIEEWIARGFKNTMKTYTLPPSYSVPGWTKLPAVHVNHRCILLRKELCGEHIGTVLTADKGWYAKKFKSSLSELKEWFPHGYIWSCNHTDEQYRSMISDAPDPEVVTCPITDKDQLAHLPELTQRLLRLMTAE